MAPGFFQVQFQGLALTLKALHGTGPGYLQDLLSLPGQISILRVRSLKYCHLMGTREDAFSVSHGSLSP